MPFLIYDNKHLKSFNNLNQNKMLLPSSYFDMNITNSHKNFVSSSPINSKLPFARSNKFKQRDKHMLFNNPTSSLATQQAIAVMDYDLGNELVLNNSNAYYKPKLVNADRRR